MTKIELGFIGVVLVMLMMIFLLVGGKGSYNTTHKYIVQDAKGWERGFANHEPVDGCTKTSEGVICGTYVLVTNKNYKK